MRPFRPLALLVVLGTALVACQGGPGITQSSGPSGTVTASSGSSAGATTRPTGSEPSDGPSASTSASPSDARVIEIDATDALRFDPAAVELEVGETVQFVVTNTGALQHEFYIGTQRQQRRHAREMAEMEGMTDEDERGVLIEAGATETLEYTAEKAGKLQFGCHVDGHYAAGMKGTITVQP